MKIKNKLKILTLMLILAGCLNKEEVKINFAKGKGYLKEHLKADEIVELKEIIRAGNRERLEAFLEKHQEIINKYPIIVKIMKSDIADINAKSEFNEAIMNFMSKKGYDEETRRKVLTMKGKIKLPNEEEKVKVTPLMAIAYYEPKIIAERLSQFTEGRLIDINEKTLYGKTALMFAAMSEDTNYASKAAFELIKAGANINEKTVDGRTALYIAAITGRKEIVALLLTAGADINEKDLKGRTMLHTFVNIGEKELIELLLWAGANVNIKDSKGGTALHYAVLKGQKEIVALLLTAGADINEKGEHGGTALHMAVQFRRKEIVKLLLAAGADVNIKDLKGITALHWAAKIRSKEIVELLLPAGANVNDKGSKGITALMVAALEGQKEIVALLLTAGATVNERNENGWTALHWAACSRKKEVVGLLLIAGANVNYKEINGGTALHWAAKSINKEIVELLLIAGANVNERDSKGRTALSIAVEKGQKEIIVLLLMAGTKNVNVNALGADGITPIGILFESAVQNEFLRALFISMINDELRIYRILLERKIIKKREEVYKQLGKFKDLTQFDLEEKTSLNALKMIIEKDLHIPIINQIFADAVIFVKADEEIDEETDKKYKFILKNSEFKFDETIFDKIKDKEIEKFKQANSLKIILFLIETLY